MKELSIENQRVWIKKVAARISHNEYKDVLLNKKCLRHSMNRIHSKDQRIRTYEMKKQKKTCS